MRVMQGPPPGGERVYTPRVDGDPIRVVLRVPTESMRRHWLREYKADLAKRPDGMGADGVMDWSHRLISEFVLRVEDYARPIDNQGGTAPVATAAELIEYGEAAVVDDIGAEVMSSVWMTEAQKKSWSKRSVSSSPETHSDSTAGVAGVPDSAAREAATTHEPQPASST